MPYLVSGLTLSSMFFANFVLEFSVGSRLVIWDRATWLGTSRLDGARWLKCDCWCETS